jgi:ferrochelatase
MSKGVLLVNLGSPDSPGVGDVRRYLHEFLMDGRVLDMPWAVRAFIVYGCILPFRPRQSAEAYHKIWTAEGSPLIAISQRLRAELQQRVSVPIELAMRYRHPSIETAVQNLSRAGVNQLLLIPLFPHYAMSSYETAVERVKQVVARRARQISLQVQPPYGDAPDYIAALVASAADYLAKDYDHLLFSFHGVPERHLRKADPTGHHCLVESNCCHVASLAHATCYRAQCFKTVAAFAAKANVPPTKFSVSFQSRLGRDPWLKPYTDRELARLAASGVKKLLVICPAFVADCLETLEEIGLRGRETFLQSGGTEFNLIPCLNTHPFWLTALQNMVVRWLTALATSASDIGYGPDAAQLAGPPRLA